MEQCRKSQPSTYLLGDINMINPDMVCSHIQRQLQVVWLGVVRQIYTRYISNSIIDTIARMA